MDREAWWATVRWVTKNWTWLNNWTHTHTHTLTERILKRLLKINNWIKSTIKMWSVGSVTQSCLTLFDPMNRSTPGLPVHHQLPEFTQTHVHRVSDAIQPSHPQSSPSTPAPNPSQHQGLFQWVSSSHEEAKVLEFQPQHQSCQWTPRTGLLSDGLVGFPYSPRDSQESSPIPQFKSISSLTLSFLHSPTLTSIHDHWKNHSLDYTDLSWQRQPRGMVWGGRRERGSGWGTRVYLWWIHVDVWQNQYNIVK